MKVKIGNETLINAAEGNGPVNALDVALRKDLGKYQKYIDGLKLIDYRVRILNSGTEAVTRVLIESEDENRRALDHGRRLAQHHRRLVPGADGFHRLQARQVRRPGVELLILAVNLMASCMIDHVSIAVRDLKPAGGSTMPY